MHGLICMAVQEHGDADELAAEASSDSEDIPLPGEMDDDDSSIDSALVESEPDSAVSSGDVHSLPAELSEAESDLDRSSDPDSGTRMYQTCPLACPRR